MAIAPFSHRDDPAVPAFPDDQHVVFMDGLCGACSRAARLIARLDRRDEFLICPAGSPLGRSVLTHYGLNPDDPESWLYLEHGHPRFSLDAIIRVGRRLGGVGHLLSILSLCHRGAATGSTVGLRATAIASWGAPTSVRSPIRICAGG